MSDGGSTERGGRLVFLIGVFKIAKATLLVLVGAGALLGVPDTVVGSLLGALQWIGALGHHAVDSAVARLVYADAHELHEVALASLLYAAVFLVEGVGLLCRRRWAEWLTVVVTASFIPFEVYELVRHPGAGKVGALALNVAIVVYLAMRRLKDRRRAPSVAQAAGVSHSERSKVIA
ncbi:MAG TPA: DUF2127 domain-containing protein [Polyangia bacterium]